ncbi:MAG: hypothetical protein K2K45_07575 [Muribaculaceae bacterium]|nr:hypothetical protein [Muribaculaceae bacterium]
MTPPELTVAIVLFVLAGGLTIWANTMLSKAKKIANEANIKCESVKEEIKELEKRNKGLNDQIDNIFSKTTSGNSRPLRYRMVKTNSFVDIYAIYTAINGVSETCILIKRFDFGDDPEFAKLEARELLDQLNGK